MALLEIAAVQPNFQNHLGVQWYKAINHGKLLSSSFVIGNDHKRFISTLKSFEIPQKVTLENQKNQFVIKAVATLESKCLSVQDGGQISHRNEQVSTTSTPSTMQPESSSDDLEQLDDREKLRRMRISKANKGNTPWNKGRKHTAETLQRIRERTKLAMQNPKVKMKLVNLGHAQTEETRVKIGEGVRLGWQRRRKKLIVQETCLFEWQNLIAEASRRGCIGEEDLQWDSYEILDKQLEKEWAQSIEERKNMSRLKGGKRAPKPAEQRRKISAAIAAKWADPEYRERVCSSLSRYHGTPAGVERRPKRKPRSNTESSGSSSRRKASDTSSISRQDTQSRIVRLKLTRRKAPRFRDPLASSKLEMIKQIRAQRAAAETNRSVAIERARQLIAEAENAAKALEVAAITSPIARASLLETRKLIAEAIQSIESVDSGVTSSDENETDASVAPLELSDKASEETTMNSEDQPSEKKVNGSQVMEHRDNAFLNFGGSFFEEIISDEDAHLPISARFPTFTFKEPMKQLVEHGDDSELKLNGLSDSKDDPHPNGQKSSFDPLEDELPSKPAMVTKKWVRGRLIEVTE